MKTPHGLERAREAYDREHWGDAYAQYSRADREEDALSGVDLERLATVAYLVGEDAEAVDVWVRAHNQLRKDGELERAARCAFWLGFVLLSGGRRARGGGWIARAGRLVEDHQIQCAVEGFLLLPDALGRLSQGDHAGACDTFTRAAVIGERFDESDLVALGRIGRGQALIRLGEREEGVSLLDEAMVAVEAGELSPVAAGIVYCAAIETCREIYDLRRAEEWTDALTRWCQSHPDLVPFRGQCLTQRAEIMQRKGAWEEAMDEAKKACSMLSRPPGEPAAGAAFYRQAELHRLEGNFSRAEEAYRRASEWGREPQPGLARLRLAQGRLEDAEAAVRRMGQEMDTPASRARVLPTYVDVMLAVDEIGAARAAADELSEIAADLDVPLLRAAAARARGAVLLEEDEAAPALERLRESRSSFEELGVPYESARTGVLIGRAHRAIGDEDTATMEFDAARRVFERLEAAPDLARIERLTASVDEAQPERGLTPRELEVLRLLTTGRTNREIASELFISDRTVDRHVSNVFAKLEVSSRAAATAFAYEHDLV